MPRSRVHFTSSHRLVRTPTSGSRTKVCFIHDFRQLQVFKALPTDNLVVKDVNDFINMKWYFSSKLNWLTYLFAISNRLCLLLLGSDFNFWLTETFRIFVRL